MRIWEQGLVATYSIPGYKEMILEHYAQYKRSDTEIVIHGVRDDAGLAAGKIAGKAIKYAYLHRSLDNQILKNVLRAEREGFDAVILGAVQDPALREAKSIVDIPVVGYGEVSMYTACMLGDRFAFVCINPEMDPLLRTQVAAHRLEGRAAATAYMECGYAELSAGVQGKPERFLEAFDAAARKSVREDNVDVLLPGQTIIAELLWKAGVTRIDDAVVLDPRLPLLRTAEMLVDMRQSGTGVARRGFYWAKPPAELVEAMDEYCR